MEPTNPLYPEYLVAGAVILVAFGLMFWYWRRRAITGRIYLSRIAFCTAWWGTFYLLEISQPAVATKVLMENIQFFAVVALPAWMFLFTLDYLRVPLRAYQKVLLWVEPLLVLLIIWTDPFTHWFRVTAAVYPSFPGPTALTSVHGWAYWANGIYSMLVILVCIILLARELIVTPFWQRLRTGFVLIAAITTALGILSVTPGDLGSSHTYLMLAGSVLSQLIVMAGVSQRQNLELIPIARETVLEQMQDPVIIVNLEGEISGANPIVNELPGFSGARTIGRKLTTISPEWQALDLSGTQDENVHRELKFDTSAGPRYYDVVVSPVKDNTQMNVGSLIVLRETTQQVLAQNELAILRRLSEELNQAADLKSAIKPASQTICQLSNSQAIFVQLVDGEGVVTQAFAFNPANETAPFSEGGAEDSTRQFAAVPQEDEFGASQEAAPGDFSKGLRAQELSKSKYLTFPLMISGNSLGWVNLVYADPEDTPDSSKLHLIHTICNSLSVTIERIRLFELEHNQREQAETLQNVSRIITSSLDFNEVLDLLLEELGQLLHYDAANIMWIEGSMARISRSRGYDRYISNIPDEFAKLEFPIQTTENVRRIVSEQRTLIVADTSAVPTWLDTHLNLKFHSWLGAPVIIEGSVVAIFSLEKEEADAFTSKDAEKLSAFAVQAALSIQNSRLFEAEKKRIRELEGLQATLTDVSGELELDQLLQKIVSRAIDLLDASVAELGLYDKTSHDLQIVVSLNLGRDTTGQHIQMGEGLMGGVAQSRLAKTVQYYAEWMTSAADDAGSDSHAGLAVPMLAGSELVGVLAVGGLPPNREYSDEEIRLLNLFAQQATVAIHNARLYENARRQAAESETLARASSVVISTLALDETLDRILEQLATVVPYDSASVLLLRNDRLEVVGGHGFGEMKRVLGAKIELDRANPGAAVFLNNKLLILKEMGAEYADFGEISGTSIQSWLGVPLNFQDRTIGILALDSSCPNQFNEENARLVQAFADQVSIALENVSLYEKALKAANRFEIQYRLTQEINANLSQDQVCSAIHRAASSLMLTECFMISLLDEDSREIFDIYMVDRGIPIPLQRRPASQGLFARVIADGISRRYDTFDETLVAKTGAVLLGEEDDDSITQSILCVPLRLGAKIKGVISVQSYLTSQYSQEDLEVLELLAGQGAIALENSRLFGEVQQLAITDPLTLLSNRRRFFELADQEFERSQRYGRPLSVIMLDIDHFKRVNDTYGHFVGDQVLQRLALICSKNIRQIDILARYGGEEFVIMTPETQAADALMTCERLRNEVVSESFATTRGPIPISISLGVVDLSVPCKSLEELLDRSDQALYHSKNSGRNCTSVWSEANALPQSPEDSPAVNLIS